MKIGIDISQAIFGTGVSDYTIDLVNSLFRIDPENKYVLFGSSFRKSKDIKSFFPQAKVLNFPPSVLNILWNQLHVVNIESFIGRIDVFHSSDWLQPPSSSAKVTTVHDLSPFLFPDEMNSGRLRNIAAVHAARMNWVVRECDKIICVSKSTALELEAIFKVPQSKISIIPEALPARFTFHPSVSQIQEVKKRFELSDYVIAIGTPQPRKNIARLVTSYLEYKTKLRLPEKLVIVGGNGWGMTDIKNDSSVVFTGYLNDLDLVCLLSGSRVFAYPSLHEGFGLPILEAFFHNVPVVTSNCSSMPEVAGEAAVLVDPKSYDSIAYGLQKALKEKNRLTVAGKRQLENFSWDNTAKETLMVYSELC